MYVKIMRGANERLFQCTHIEVTHYPVGGASRQLFTPDQIGTEVQCCPSGPNLRIPRDGDVIYITNDRGDTVSSFRATAEAKKQWDDYVTNNPNAAVASSPYSSRKVG